MPDFDRRYTRLLAGLAALDRRPDTVIHLFAENVVVDTDGRPTAVLDFGVLSGAGDPRFDAAVTAATMNMYGTHAAAITETLTDAFADHLGHPPHVLRLYRAAYATATSSAFTTDGSDGHSTGASANSAQLRSPPHSASEHHPDQRQMRTCCGRPRIPGSEP